MKLLRLITWIFCLLYSGLLSAQEFSNKGKDFWLGYGYHVRMLVGQTTFADNGQELILYFTSDQNANVTVEIPGLGYARTYTVSANQVTVSQPIPKTASQDARITGPGTFNSGIHITSDRPIVAYAHIYDQNVSGASLLFPTNTLGKEYYSVNYTQRSNELLSNSFFFVVATEDNTSVEITPSAANLNGLPVGAPSTVNLNKGQIYSVMGTTVNNTGTDLTGSKIKSVPKVGSSSICKPIAVFSGSGKINIGQIFAGSGSSDNLFAQAFPSNAWGKRYLTAPTGSQPNNFFRVCVKNPATVVKLNGNVLPASSLINGFYYQFKNGNQSGTNDPIPNLIEADQPVLVAQYCTTQGLEGNPSTGGGDPEMIYLSPVEQTINKVTLYSASQYAILGSFINVIIKNNGVNSFKLDGIPLSNSLFQPHPGDTAYSYMIIKVSSGTSHSLYSDSGFNAIAYGFGEAESYGYNAGTNVIDLNPPISIRNDYASSGIRYSATCTNTPFKVYVTLPYQATQLSIHFSSSVPVIGPKDYTHSVPTGQADSTYLANGKIFYIYNIPVSYIFTATGTFPISLSAKSVIPQSDGCSSNDLQEFDDVIVVNDPPIADFDIVSSGCINTNISFADKTNGFGRPVYKWFWEFGDGSRSVLEAPSKIINQYTSTVKLRSVTDYGCIADTAKTIQLSNKPVAKFNYALPLCVNANIQLNDSSTLANSPNNNRLTKWIWDTDDGTVADTLLKNDSVVVKYSTSGNKNIRLLVSTNTGCLSAPYQPLFLINPLPVVSFKTPEVCLDDAFAPFLDESTISDKTEALFTRRWTFPAGTPASATTKSAAVRYPAPGPYTASLRVRSGDGCVDSLTQSFFVNGSTPKAAFDIINQLPYCQPAPIQIRNKSYVDIGNIVRLEIYWDYANNPSLVETDEDPLPDKVYSHFYPDLQLSTAQNYTIRVVAYSGGGTCVSFIEKKLSIYPRPKAKFTISDSVICSKELVQFTNQSKGVSSLPKTYFWTFGSAGNSALVNPTMQFIDSGNYAIRLFFVNEDGCTSDTASGNIMVNPNPTVALKERQSLILGASVQFMPDSLSGTNLTFLWSPATELDNPLIQSPICTATDDITYTLQVTSTGGCTATDEIFILVLKPPIPPNAFSPNGDGINDTWQIKYLGRYPDATVDVYDRYGQPVFHATNYTSPWDGTNKGKSLQIGTYYYIINPKNGLSTLSGSVTIVK